MKGRAVALDRLNGHTAAALLVDGRIQDLLTTPRASSEPAPETLYRAVVDRPLKGQGGAFLRLPGGLRGFVRHAKGLRSGHPVAVQVTGYAERGKAIPLTTRLIFKGRYCIATPGAPGANISRQIRDRQTRAHLQELADSTAPAEGPGLILRSAAGQADDDAVRDDIHRQTRAALDFARQSGTAAPELLAAGPDAHALALREWGDAAGVDDTSGVFDALGVSDAIERFLSPDVALAAGASASVEPTRALVAIDIDTGADQSPAAGLKANLALAGELPRQLRCRGLGGQIVVDAAPMSKAHRPRMEQALRRALADDPVDTAVVGWTPLGHLELQRKRERVPLARIVGL